MSKIHAVIMAGGFGKRLQPLTYVLPKPLMPIDNDLTVIEVIISQLQALGVHKITITTGYFADLVSSYLSKKIAEDIEVNFVEEKEPMGTIGALSKLQFDGDELIFLLNADILTTLDFKDMVVRHLQAEACLTVATYSMLTTIQKGVLSIDPNSQVTGVTEKPTFKHFISMGLYVINPEVINFIPKLSRYDAPDLINKLLSLRKKVNSYKFEGYWLDIGLPEDYEKALADFSKKKHELIKKKPKDAYSI